MAISATEINKVGPEQEQDLGMVEVKYHLRWDGVTDQSMEKDATVFLKVHKIKYSIKYHVTMVYIL